MRHSEGLWKLLLCTVASAVLLPTTGSAQFRPKDTEWPSYAADLAGSRYRSLDQINASNFNDLEIAWRIKTDNFGDRPEYKLEGTPLMVNGVLYATAGSRRAVIALDPGPGEGYGDYRRSVSRRYDAEEHAQQQGICTRLRRSNREASLDFPHHSEEG